MKEFLSPTHWYKIDHVLDASYFSTSWYWSSYSTIWTDWSSTSIAFKVWRGDSSWEWLQINIIESICLGLLSDVWLWYYITNSTVKGGTHILDNPITWRSRISHFHIFIKKRKIFHQMHYIWVGVVVNKLLLALVKLLSWIP